MPQENTNTSELYFEWWLGELKKKGLVAKWEREPQSLMVLKPSLVYSKVHFVQKEPRIVTHTLCPMASYTYDYAVEFHRSLLDTFIGYLVPDDPNTYELRELRPRTKKDTFYEFSYYYVHNSDFHQDYIKVYFDVKPTASAIRFSAGLGSSREFPYNQKLMLENYGIFVNKVIPVGSRSSLFEKTFVPTRYFLTDGGTKERKINPKNVKFIRTIDEWMKMLNLSPVENEFTKN